MMQNQLVQLIGIEYDSTIRSQNCVDTDGCHDSYIVLLNGAIKWLKNFDDC